MRLTGGVISTFLVAASASAQTDMKRTIDLDHAAPAELLIVDNGVSTIHYWSPQNGMWLNLFRSDFEIEGIADDPQSSLSQIKSDGRYWQWRNDAYVPIVAEPAVIAGELEDHLFVKAAGFLDYFDEVPENSPANAKVTIEIDGEASFAALLGGTIFCALGGNFCPVVIFKDGEPLSSIYVTINQPWGFSHKTNENGYPYIESQLDRSLLITDTETREEEEILGFLPQESHPQPIKPKDLPQ